MSVAVGQRVYEPSYGEKSAVLVDQALSSSALGANSTNSGIACQANGDTSQVTGTMSRTGNPSRDFTCAANGTTLTIASMDVTSEFYVGGGLTPNIRIGYILDGKKLTVDRVITALAFTGGDTQIDIDASIDAVTIAGVCVDAAIGNGAKADGLVCIATGVNSQASGSYATAEGAGSVADGIQVTSEKRSSRATGYGVSTTDFNEQAHGSPWFQQVGDNTSRRLALCGLCPGSSSIKLYLDNTDNTPAGAGIETIVIPDNSFCNLTVKLAAFQADDSLANHGDAWTLEIKAGMLKMAGVLSFVGSGVAIPIIDERNGASTWSLDFDISGPNPVVNFIGQNGVIARCIVELEQIWRVN